MRTKVYILLKIQNGQPADIAFKLRGQLGVKTVELLDGSPEIMVTVEANSRKKLISLSIAAMKSVEKRVEFVKLLPVQEVSKVPVG